MRMRLALLLALLLSASPVLAQRLDGGVRLNGAMQGTTLNNPIFTGQWTVNAVLCATGTVLQGGSPTTCTASPIITNLSATGVIYGTNSTALSADPAGWGARMHLAMRDNSDMSGAPVFEIINGAADADFTPLGLLEWVAPANTSGNEMTQVYSYSRGTTALNRGGQFRFLTKKDGANTMQEALRLDASGTGASATAIVFNPNSQSGVLDVGNNGSGNLISAKATSGNSAYLWLSSGATTNRTGVQLVSNGTTKWFINSANAVDTPNDKLQIVNAGFTTEVMTILQGGTVGINQSSPSATYKLDVNGPISGATYYSNGSGMNVANVGANSCGTTAATVAGNSNAFVVTVGATAGTQCRVQFPAAAPAAWVCAANDDTTTTAVRTTPVDTTHLDLIGAFTAGDAVSAVCFPR